MNLSSLALRYKTVVLSIVALLMVVGARSYFTLPAQEDPHVTVREAVITTRYPGLSPQRMEMLVTKKLEEAVRQLPELKEIRSTTRTGVSIIHASMESKYFDLEQIWDKLRDKVEEATPQLPPGTQKPDINDSFGDVAVLTVALTAPDYTMAEQYNIAKHVKDQLYSITGTKKVDLHGVQNEQISIEVSNARVAELGLSAEQIINTVRAQNTIEPGGEVDIGERTFILEPSGNFDGVAQIGETQIALPNGRGTIPLRDIAEISREPIDPPTPKAYYNGENAIIFAVAMRDGVRVLDYAPIMRDKIEEVESTLPVGYNLDIVTYQAEQVGNAVYGVTSSVLQTLVIVLAVVTLFLGVRTGLIVGAIVPSVMLITLAIMSFTGIPLERMSLATMVIALGLLVDNGIVIAEDFKRRLELGTSRDEALRQTGGELAMPLLSSTLTTVLVFLPLMLADHEAGEFTRSISLIVLISLFTSWVLAIMVTPVLCHKFMRVKVKSEIGAPGEKAGAFDRIEGSYESLLRHVLKRRGLFLILMLIMLVAGVMGMRMVPKKFFPASDRAQVLITLDLPAETSLKATDTLLKRVFPVLKDQIRFPHLQDFAAYAGYGGPRFVMSLSPLDPAPNKAFLVINLDEIGSMQKSLEDLRVMFNEEFPEINARVSDMFLGPTDPGVFQLQVKGPDIETIYSKAKEIEVALAQIPGNIDIWQNWENPIPKLDVNVNQSLARRSQVSSTGVASSLQRYFNGQTISQLRDGDDLYPIVTRGTDRERNNLERLYSLGVETADGMGTVPLEQVAEIELDSEYAVIQREDMTRTVTIETRPLGVTPEDLVKQVDPIIERLSADLPPGHSIEYDGVIVDSTKGKMALAANMPLCLAALFLLLLAQFNSFRRPLLILATIPLLAFGAAVGLNVMGATFGFMVVLGILALAGIIINNAIVLIDRIDIEMKKDGVEPIEAIVAAAKTRLRPIIMTTVTTIVGLMPLLIAQDRLFYGMATVIAFGLGVGTILTLGLVPVLYAMLFKIKEAPQPDGLLSLKAGLAE
ncbi:efflux RND transporter permease subunit [Flexibacterium corallicola]|uniref:efflux RND transporter permease subunit n=1 Tax=Flexibacterium corallicola TaxID=3037259 RepID=UPI00286EEC81|nr:efflux RND transporter permease subunit [Pseudovibrio sp. M1P-2-3]